MADVAGTSRPSANAAVEDLVGALVRAMKNVTFYPPEHPMVAEMTQEATRAVERAVARGECMIKFIGGEVVVDDRPMFHAPSSVGSLVGACHNRGIDSITFVPGVKPNEVGELIKVLATDPEQARDEGGAAAMLGRRGVTHVAVDSLRAVSQPSGNERSLAPAREIYAGALDITRSAVRCARSGTPLNVEGAEHAVDRLIDAILREQSTMMGLVSVKNYDEYTFTHSLHICILCLGLGYAIGLPAAQLKELGVAALLHDVGKVFVPLEILRKPDKLTPDEFNTIARHAIDGALILFGHERVPAVAPVVAFEHHIQYNGSGYPQIGKRWDLNLYSLMVSIADVYDALTTERPYRPPLSPERALETMHESEREQFEPRLMARFIETLGKHPAGTLVRLRRGVLAVVPRANPAAGSRPFVRRVIDDGEGRALDPEELDLSRRDPHTGEHLRAIAEVLDPAAEQVEVADLLGSLARLETV